MARGSAIALAAVACAGWVLAGCAGAGSSRRSHPQPAYGAYLRGLLLEHSAELPAALDAYERALEQDRNSALLNVRVGAAHLKLGHTDQALKAFSKALAIDPDQPDALRWVAMLHASRGELDQAVAAYERLIVSEPQDEFVLSTLADLYVLQGRLDDAIGLYERMVQEDPEAASSQLYFNLGVLYGRLNRFDEGLQALSRALERSPESLDIRIALGLTYELAERFDQAAAHYEDAISLDPFNPRLYHHAARARLSAKSYAKAAANYLAVLDLTPRDLEAITGLVRVWLAQSRYDEAERFLAGKIGEMGDTPELYLVLGLVFREARHTQEALRAFERAIEQKPSYAPAHFYLAAQLDELGRKEEACASLRHTLELDPKHPDAMNYLGYLQAELDINLEEAEALIERALEFDPTNGAYVDSLGWVYYKMGRFDEAITLLERAAELLETDSVIFDHLGDAYLKRQDLERARRSWERALELDPGEAGVAEKLERLAPQGAVPGQP